MKFAVIIEYGDDKIGLEANYPAHRAYLRSFLDTGQVWAAGPFACGAGALWVLDADTAEAAEEIVKGDPFVAAGVMTSWRVRHSCIGRHRKRRARASPPMMIHQTAKVFWFFFSKKNCFFR